MAAEPLGVWGAESGMEGHLRALPTPQNPDFEDLYREHFDRLRRFCLGMTGRESVAEDIAQETLLRAYIRMEKLDLNRPMWPWLKQVATRLVYDHTRGEREVCSEDSELAVDTCADVADQLAERDLVARVLSRLPARQRAAVTLRYLEDWKAGELAELFNLPRPAVEQLLLRARRSLGAEYRRLGADRIRIALWPLLALLGRIRDRAVRLTANLGTASTTSVASVMDATTQAMVAVVVSSGLIAGGIAFADPVPFGHQEATVASVRQEERQRVNASTDQAVRQAKRINVTPARAAREVQTQVSRERHVDPMPTVRSRRLNIQTPNDNVMGNPPPEGRVAAGPKRDKRNNRVLVDREVDLDLGATQIYARGRGGVQCNEGPEDAAACNAYDAADAAAPKLP